MTNYCNPYPYHFFFSSFCFVRHFRLSLLNNFYCDILHLYNILFLIIGSVTSANLKKAGMASRNIVMKNNTCCSDQLCSSLWTSRFWLLVICKSSRFEETRRARWSRFIFQQAREVVLATSVLQARKVVSANSGNTSLTGQH